MTERKIVPITGKHTTFSSMMAEAMADLSATRGMIIYFDEEGTMRHGHVGATRSDICMASALVQEMATAMMRAKDE